ncbi:MAG: extracellular solute-binding protein [Candidatus Hadarchaeum sp.]|uniref:ABC transporter substrate-binding protein n=1 Tax=Candidatus Hadarchaeum sp. TaxID=2883567 RepID=UPI00317B2AD0
MKSFASGVALVLLVGMCFSVAGGSVELSFWIFINPEGTDPRGMALRQTIEDFNATHPDIHIAVQYIHWREIDNRIIQATAVGAGPDLFDFYLPNLSLHIEAGTLLPLDPTVVANWLSECPDYAYAIDSLVQDGKIWGMPWEARVWVLWYREDYLAEAGLEVPQSLNDLITVASKLTSPTRIGFALGLSEASLGAEFIEKYQMLIRAAGGQLFDDQLRPLVNTEPGVQAMEWVRQLFATGGATPACLNMTADDVLNGIGAGTIAMACEGSMRVATARSYLGEKGVYLKTAPFPSFSIGTPAPALTAVRYIGIGKNCRDINAAWTFIKYWLSEDIQKLWAIQAGILPVRRAILADSFFSTTNIGREMANWLSLVADFGFIERYPSDFSYFSELMARAAQKVVLYGISPKEALDEVVTVYLGSKR